MLERIERKKLLMNQQQYFSNFCYFNDFFKSLF